MDLLWIPIDYAVHVCLKGVYCSRILVGPTDGGRQILPAYNAIIVECSIVLEHKLIVIGLCIIIIHKIINKHLYNTCLIIELADAIWLMGVFRAGTAIPPKPMNERCICHMYSSYSVFSFCFVFGFPLL